MNEHESNLFDLYAGLAMSGFLASGHNNMFKVSYLAFDMAEQMMIERKERLNAKEAGIPVALSEMEKRKDGDAEAPKKTKARTKAV